MVGQMAVELGWLDKAHIEAARQMTAHFQQDARIAARLQKLEDELAALEAENLGSVHADVRREIAGRQLARSPKSADVSAQPKGLVPIH